MGPPNSVAPAMPSDLDDSPEPNCDAQPVGLHCLHWDDDAKSATCSICTLSLHLDACFLMAFDLLKFLLASGLLQMMPACSVMLLSKGKECRIGRTCAGLCSGKWLEEGFDASKGQRGKGQAQNPFEGEGGEDITSSGSRWANGMAGRAKKHRKGGNNWETTAKNQPNSFGKPSQIH